MIRILLFFLLLALCCASEDHAAAKPVATSVEHKDETHVPHAQPIQELPEDKKQQEVSADHHEEVNTTVHQIEKHEKQNVNQQPQISQAHGSTSRQFHPMYQPVFPSPSGFNMIRRQFGGGMDILGDIVMMGMIGLPILGLLTVGSSSIANFLGFGASSSSSSKRNKRSLKDRAAGAVEYAKDLWDVMEQLERAFEKYDLYQVECQLRAVCEAHSKVPSVGAWRQTILELMSKEKELQRREILPVSRFLFSNYDDAALVGTRGENCAQVYTGCPHHLSYYLSAKDEDMENEIQVEM